MQEKIDMFKTQNRLRQKSERDKVRERGDARTTQKTRSSNETFLSESGDDTGGRWSVLQQKTRVRLNIAETTQSSVEVDDIPLSFFFHFLSLLFLELQGGFISPEDIIFFPCTEECAPSKFSMKHRNHQTPL